MAQIRLLAARLLESAAGELIFFHRPPEACVSLAEHCQAVAVAGQRVEHTELIGGRRQQQVLVLRVDIHQVQRHIAQKRERHRRIVDERPRTPSGRNFPAENHALRIKVNVVLAAETLHPGK